MQSAPSRDQLKNKASDLYDELDNMGVTMSRDATEEMANRVTQKATEFGFHPKIHPKVAAAMEEIERIALSPTTLKELDTARRIMGQAASSIEPAEKALAMQLIDVIDKRMANLSRSDIVRGSGNAKLAGDTYKKARKLWQRNRKSELIEEAMEKAKNQASGFENGIRTQFRSLLNNKKKMRGFSDEEKAMIKRVVTGGNAITPRNLSKILGHFGFLGKGQSSFLGGSIGTAAGFGMGGPVGAVAVPLMGQAAKANSARLTENAANLVDATIRKGSGPVNRATPNTLFDAASIYAPQALLND